MSTAVDRVSLIRSDRRIRSTLAVSQEIENHQGSVSSHQLRDGEGTIDRPMAMEMAELKLSRTDAEQGGAAAI